MEWSLYNLPRAAHVRRARRTSDGSIFLAVPAFLLAYMLCLQFAACLSVQPPSPPGARSLRTFSEDRQLEDTSMGLTEVNTPPKHDSSP